MKSFVTIFILILFFQSSSTGDDIGDFQIDGINVGDTLLKYMSEDEILIEKEKRKNYYSHLGDPLFYEVYSFGRSSQYNYISFFLKPKARAKPIYDIRPKKIIKTVNKNFFNPNKSSNSIKLVAKIVIAAMTADAMITLIKKESKTSCNKICFC